MVDWIARAQAKFSQIGPNHAAETAKTEVSAVLAARPTQISKRPLDGFGSFGSPPTMDLRRNDVIQKGEDKVDLVREFMEVDGFSLTDAQSLAAVSIKPRSVSEWLALIAELDALIERYCIAVAINNVGKAAIMAIRRSQSLASIPESLAWFRNELRCLTGADPPLPP